MIARKEIEICGQIFYGFVIFFTFLCFVSDFSTFLCFQSELSPNTIFHQIFPIKKKIFKSSNLKLQKSHLRLFHIQRQSLETKNLYCLSFPFKKQEKIAQSLITANERAFQV
jgi:hypothetical protein